MVISYCGNKINMDLRNQPMSLSVFQKVCCKIRLPTNPASYPGLHQESCNDISQSIHSLEVSIPGLAQPPHGPCQVIHTLCICITKKLSQDIVRLWKDCEHMRTDQYFFRKRWPTLQCIAYEGTASIMSRQFGHSRLRTAVLTYAGLNSPICTF